MKPSKKPNQRIGDDLPTVGWGPFRYEWYSICSGHGLNDDGRYYWFDTDCPRCMAGVWTNCWKLAASHVVEKYCYPLWYWWANHKNKKAK